MYYEKIIHNPGTTFSYKVYPYFTMPWHYHPEFELIVITSGGGKRFAGDYMGEYHPGELVLYGGNLPHFHMCYGLLEDDPDRISESEVVQFNSDIFPANLIEVDEYAVVADLLERSKRGVQFTNPPSVERITNMMRSIDSFSGIRRIYTLMRILEILGRSEEYKLLSSGGYSFNIVDDDNDPVNKVYRYLTNHFKQEVTLDEVAEHVGFNPSALCRYFKRRAQKSIFECLADIRIDFACKLLANSPLPISQIAYESGYKNIAHFNRQFKNITEHTPTQYRELCKKKL